MNFKTSSFEARTNYQIKQTELKSAKKFEVAFFVDARTLHFYTHTHARTLHTRIYARHTYGARFIVPSLTSLGGDNKGGDNYGTHTNFENRWTTYQMYLKRLIALWDTTFTLKLARFGEAPWVAKNRAPSSFPDLAARCKRASPV